MEPLTEDKNTGFWIRFFATWIDCIIIYMALKLIFYSLLYSSTFIYFPFEFSFFVAGIIYSIISVSINGQTIGKYLLGITVTNKDGSKLSFFKTVLRESVLKLISGVVLLFGFFWIGFSKNKKGWHDYFCKSKVIPKAPLKRINYYWKIIAITSFTIFFSKYIWNFVSDIVDAKKISISPATLKLPFMERNPSTVTDVSLLRDSVLVNWLNNNYQSPEEYAIQAAKTHQITLFGEAHESGDNLSFFNKIIQPLYIKSGIRVIAMEIIPASMNKKVEKLVNANNYDTTLALEIARTQCWKMWGFKEYWDVLETVWKLNKSLPNGAERMRVVGIDNDWTMPNLSLIGGTEDSKGKTALWEKFRFFSVIKDIPSIVFRDEIMAGNIEKEIINKKQKAVVLIGFNHSVLNWAYPVVKNNKVISAKARFGVLLNKKYPGQFFQIELYQRLDYNENNRICQNSIDTFLDSIMNKRNNQPIGFSISNSPFYNLRDSCSYFFTQFPSICYGDITQGVIFLKPLNKKPSISWMKGYISDEMFMNYKPMYDLVFKGNYKNANEINQLIIQTMAKGEW